MQLQFLSSTSLRLTIDTYAGSSGAPLLYFGDSEVGIVIMAVHLRGRTDKETECPMYNEGCVLTEAFLKEMMDTFRE